MRSTTSTRSPTATIRAPGRKPTDRMAGRGRRPASAVAGTTISPTISTAPAESAHAAPVLRADRDKDSNGPRPGRRQTRELLRHEGREPLANAPGERDDLLAFVESERLTQRCDRVLAPAGGFEHLREVVVAVALDLEHVGVGRDLDRLARQPFRLGMVASKGEDERLDLPPERLRIHILRAAELPALLGQYFGFLVAAECA